MLTPRPGQMVEHLALRGRGIVGVVAGTRDDGQILVRWPDQIVKFPGMRGMPGSPDSNDDPCLRRHSPGVLELVPTLPTDRSQQAVEAWLAQP